MILIKSKISVHQKTQLVSIFHCGGITRFGQTHHPVHCKPDKMCERAVFRHETVPEMRQESSEPCEPLAFCPQPACPRVWWGHPRLATPLREGFCGHKLWEPGARGRRAPALGRKSSDTSREAETVWTWGQATSPGRCAGLEVQSQGCRPCSMGLRVPWPVNLPPLLWVPQNAQLGPVPLHTPPLFPEASAAWGSWIRAGCRTAILGCNLSQLPIKIP